MSYAFVKIATIGGATVAAGGGVAVNAFVFPKSEEVATQYEKTTYKDEDKGESLKSKEDSLPEQDTAEQEASTTESSPSKEVTPIEEKREERSPYSMFYLWGKGSY